MILAWPAIVILAAIGLALLAGVLFAATGGVHLLRARRRVRRAETAHANGHALLQMADEIETHARALALTGQPTSTQRGWARLCRRVAVEHLACINALLLEPGAGAGFIGEQHDHQKPPDTSLR
ncbi:MAG: hypothetical protein ACREO8_05295 [Luteimonas sp.]